MIIFLSEHLRPDQDIAAITQSRKLCCTSGGILFADVHRDMPCMRHHPEFDVEDTMATNAIDELWGTLADSEKDKWDALAKVIEPLYYELKQIPPLTEVQVEWLHLALLKASFHLECAEPLWINVHQTYCRAKVRENIINPAL